MPTLQLRSLIRTNIEHLITGCIFTEGELGEKVVVAEIATTTQTVDKALLLQGFDIVGTAFLI